MGIRHLSRRLQEAVETDPNEPFFGKGERPAGKWVSAGCVIFDSIADLDKIYLVKQGSSWTFPKGRVEKGASLKKTASREVGEETGLSVSFLEGGYLGTGEADLSVTHYYAAVRSGGALAPTDGSTKAIKLASFTRAYLLIKNCGGHSVKRDLKVLQKAYEFANKFRRSRSA
jgi:ADP-ribose pyrophosphatase YjhB (NUDIX family)